MSSFTWFSSHKANTEVLSLVFLYPDPSKNGGWFVYDCAYADKVPVDQTVFTYQELTRLALEHCPIYNARVSDRTLFLRVASTLGPSTVARLGHGDIRWIISQGSIGVHKPICFRFTFDEGASVPATAELAQQEIATQNAASNESFATNLSSITPSTSQAGSSTQQSQRSGRSTGSGFPEPDLSWNKMLPFLLSRRPGNMPTGPQLIECWQECTELLREHFDKQGRGPSKYKFGEAVLNKVLEQVRWLPLTREERSTYTSGVKSYLGENSLNNWILIGTWYHELTADERRALQGRAWVNRATWTLDARKWMASLREIEQLKHAEHVKAEEPETIELVSSDDDEDLFDGGEDTTERVPALN